MDNYQNQLAQWLKMYDDQGLGKIYENQRVNGLPVSQTTQFNVPQMRMNWALGRMNQGQEGGGMPDFWGMQTGQMNGANFAQGQGGQGGYQNAPYAAPTRNWLTKMGG